MAARYRDSRSGKFISGQVAENPIEVEDAIIDEFKRNEFLLFPEDAANVDKKSLDALQASYKYDMSKNSNILGDLSFKDYLEQVNPELLRQRSVSDKALDSDYIGPFSDRNNGVSRIAHPLKSAAKQFGDSYTRLITSAKRAFTTVSNFESNLEKTLQKTNQDLRRKMLPMDSKK